MDPKAIKFLDFAQNLRTDNWGSLMAMDMSGLSFQDAIRMADMLKRTQNFHNRIQRDLNSLLKSQGAGVEVEVYEEPVVW